MGEGPQSEGAAAGPPSAERMPPWLVVLLVGLVVLRVGYHSAYLTEVPFGLATFSDGRLYERAALDIVAHPPWGTEPFYLQGLYAYQLALPMFVRPWISLGLLLQLVLAGLALWGSFRATAPLVGRTAAGVGLAVLLAYPGLAFYENKYLTASLAVVTMIAMLVALGRLQRRPTAVAMVGLGVATGLAVLARGNMALALPGVVVAALLAWAPTAQSNKRALGWLALGLVLSIGPMALRNAVVTGRPTVMPVHGGGTSFYIGNNQHARGVWNNAGGLLSGEVVHEREELAARLGVAPGPVAQQSAAIGAALYRRALDEMAEDPARWAWLELRKAWLSLGNDELSQDYDVEGERELLPWWTGRGLPFTVVLGLGLVGIGVLRRRAQADAEFATRWRPWKYMLGAQALAVVAANLLFFTSAQHRLPIVAPLTVFVGPAVVWLVSRGRDRDGVGRPRPDRRAWWPSAALLAVVVAQGAWPRQHSDGPTAVHYYNLALAYVRLGQPTEAIAAFDRAVERRPDHAVIIIERATMLRRFGMLDRAAADLERLSSLPGVPPWIRQRAADELRRVQALRALAPAPPVGAPSGP